MNHKVLETRQKDVCYSVIHGLLKNRDRLFQQGRAEESLCLRTKLAKAWWSPWLRAKVLELISDQGPVPVVSNIELIMLMYPKCRREAEAVFLLCTFMELVDREVAGKQKELLVGTLRGVLRAKVEQLASRAVPDINFPPGWI